MAEEHPKSSERFRIDRRRLPKGSVASFTAAKVAPVVKLSETEPIFSAQAVSTAFPKVLNLSAATGRRLDAIARRNDLRREAKLPLLPIAKELRRAKETEDSETFSEAFGPFAAKHRQAVWDEVLKSRRETEGPNWRPRFLEGMAHQGEVFRILRERFGAQRM